MQRKRNRKKTRKIKRHHKRHTRKKLKGGGLSKGKIAAAVLAGVAAAAGTGYLGYKNYQVNKQKQGKVWNELGDHFRKVTLPQSEHKSFVSPSNNLKRKASSDLADLDKRDFKRSGNPAKKKRKPDHTRQKKRRRA